MASIYKRGKTYWIKYYVEGSPKYESLRTTDKKQALIAKASKEMEERTGISVARRNITVAEFAQEYLIWYSKQYPERYDGYTHTFTNEIIPKFGKDRLASIDPQKVSKWMHERVGSIGHKSGRPLKRSYINQELTKFKAMCNRAVEWGVIDRSPIMAVRKLTELDSKPRKFFTAEQLRAIYDADVSYSAIWQLLANTGMRISEAANLKWQDVHTSKLVIVSSEEHATKSRKWREIPLTENASMALIQLRGKHDVYVLPRVSRKTLRNRFQAACRKAGLEGTPHELRHTFISQLVMQGIPLRTVQVLAGHSTITVTEKYSHLSPDHLASAVSGLRL